MNLLTDYIPYYVAGKAATYASCITLVTKYAADLPDNLLIAALGLAMAGASALDISARLRYIHEPDMEAIAARASELEEKLTGPDQAGRK
jgi:hypothetical protein